MSITALKRKTEALQKKKVTPTFGKNIRTRGSYTKTAVSDYYVYKKSNTDSISTQSFNKKI